MTAGTPIATVKNVLDRLESFHQLTGRRHRGGARAATGATGVTHRHARPLRDRAIHDLQVTGADRQLGALRPHDLRHTFAYLLSQASGHNRAELERRLGHANERYLRLYTNPPEDIAAAYVEDL
ncbi:tyrosine-type recombinase/integrase [Streptosporangium sp. NBC_01639]|uniref:tyrosine-type recombinase/integrase n=1 Tax=Streptosporangium sp. NBC_01639 TaxID=2975948 RepID=UPI00386C8807|nr:tyrosine-type recombinase/integrase [Streptosporangium sp. NBC_01639]